MLVIYMTISTDIIWYPDREVVVLLLQCIVALPSLLAFSLFLLFLLALSPLFPLFLSAGKVYPAGKLGNFCKGRYEPSKSLGSFRLPGRRQLNQGPWLN